MFMIFSYFIEFTKVSPFHGKLWRNLQSLQWCKTSPRLHNGTSNTAFESLDVIVLNMIIFGYHNGTQNTQNFTYVRHLKWGRLERGHFELKGIRQQDSVDNNHYHQKVRLGEFVSKVYPHNSHFWQYICKLMFTKYHAVRISGFWNISNEDHTADDKLFIGKSKWITNCYSNWVKSLIEMLYHRNPSQFEYYRQSFIRVLKLNTFCVFSPRGTFQKRF